MSLRTKVANTLGPSSLVPVLRKTGPTPLGPDSTYEPPPPPPPGTFPLDTVTYAGVCNWYGTNFGAGAWTNPATAGRLVLSLSTAPTGSASAWVDRTGGGDNRTQNVANSWVKVDFDPAISGRRVNPTHLTIRQRVPYGSELFRSLLVEGSDDNTAWTSLGTGTGLGVGQGAWLTVALTSAKGWRYIRITQTSTDSSGSNYFCLDEVEFFGSTT